MVNVKFYGKLLEKTDLRFENEAVLNPACIQKDGQTHMLYRAVSKGNFSSLGSCLVDRDKIISRARQPILVPEFDYEIHGVEDPRITKVGDTYYLFYAAYDGKNARTALATSTDLISFQKHGLVSPSITYEQARQLFDPGLPEGYNWYALHYEDVIAPDVMLWSKDMVLFPKKINGKFLILYRVMPGMQYAYADDLAQLSSEKFWIEQIKRLHEHTLINPKLWFENRKVGACCPPIETPSGWVLIYHAVEHKDTGNTYRASALLLDLNDPAKVIGRLPEPLFSPHESWEETGISSNVVFPSGAGLYGDELYIYYGAADSCIATASVSLPELVKELINNP